MFAALRDEWGLLVKMVSVPEWSREQKVARQDNIVAMLLSAGQALPKEWKR